MELAIPFLAMFVGIAIGFLASYMHSASERTQLKERLAIAKDRLAKDEHLREENETLRIQRAQLQKEHEVDAEKMQWVEEAQERLREAFEALASKALRSNADAFLKRTYEQLNTLLTGIKGDWGVQREEVRNLVQPLEKTLATMDMHVRTLEEKREGAYKSLEQHLASLSQAHTQLRDTTITLAQALRSPTVRGR
ncbi:DNA recombination protein RmuC [archaeon]|nr:MAG: DNA recombination protein RmuC [archaeon]